MGGSDETDRDRTGTQDPDDGEESGGKSAVDEKDKAGAEEEKEDTPQVGPHITINISVAVPPSSSIFMYALQHLLSPHVPFMIQHLS